MVRIRDFLILLCIILVILSISTAGCLGHADSESRNASAPTNTNQSLENSSRIIAISAGLTHHLTLYDNGTVRAWAGNMYGSCNSGECAVPQNLTNNVTAIAAGDGFSAALTKERKVIVWGCRWSPPPRAPRTIPPVGKTVPAMFQ